MLAPIQAPEATHERHPRGNAPDWNAVSFEVGCARCGHDLRGLTEPKCPACGLEFDWAKAVPIEQLTCRKCGYHLYGLRDTRCPECGEAFTWDQALDDYHRRQKPLFEYQWRDRPIRLLIRSWFLALRPRRLWTWIDLHDPPRPKPLLWMAVVALLIVATAMSSLTGLIEWLTDRVAHRYQGPMPPTLGDLPAYLSNEFLTPSSFVPLMVLAVWWLSSLAALMIFQQSMRLAKVRAAHVLRVWVLSLVLPSSMALMVGWLWVLIYLVLSDVYYWPARYGWDAFSFFVAGCFYPLVLWSVGQGYRLYLRMPQGLAVVISSQLVVLLALAIFIGPVLILR